MLEWSNIRKSVFIVTFCILIGCAVLFTLYYIQSNPDYSDNIYPDRRPVPLENAPARKPRCVGDVRLLALMIEMHIRDPVRAQNRTRFVVDSGNNFIDNIKLDIMSTNHTVTLYNTRSSVDRQQLITQVMRCRPTYTALVHVRELYDTGVCVCAVGHSSAMCLRSPWVSCDSMDVILV